MVFSGIVLTQPSTTRSATYIVSAYAGSLTPVEAHSGRWRLAPSVLSLAKRSLANASSKAPYASRAFATAALPFSALASSVPIASRRLSTSVSTRDTKNDATEWMPSSRPPWLWARSRPDR